ncbi:MAG TPA: hypothetical protein VE035_17160 [Puia sp.]|nr:hypothetical protein [Puia sp.]
MATENQGKKTRDVWDIIQIVGSALIPAAIALAGFFYSNAVKKAEDAANELKNNKDIEIATLNSQVNQAQLLATFMEPLVSKDSLKQAIAINAILIGMPIQGKQILDLLARNKNKSETQSLASTALNSRRTQLIKGLYSSDKVSRLNAASELSNTWIRDTATVQELMQEMSMAIADTTWYPNAINGIYNCLVVLQNADKNGILPIKEKLQALVARIPATDEKTIAAANKVLDKVRY